MNKKKLVKFSNIIGLIAIILLIYWVFVFISVEVFGLKVFRENLTESFYFSIMGILALMFGALIINVMLNLTRIAEKHNQDDILKRKTSKKLLIAFILSFPIIFGLLFGGDKLTSIKKEKMLIVSAKSIVENNAEKTNKLVDYSFDKKWINETSKILNLFSSTDTYFSNISVIILDTLDNSECFLHFEKYNYYKEEIEIVINDTTKNDTIKKTLKIDFILKTTKIERDYLNEIFQNKTDKIRFSAHNGNYELFYPYKNNGKIIVLYFSDYQRYGKIGS
ncbi:MAG: hypothetical protein LBU51_01425 [Bacteroidales bacterium]|jgi:hypothetical protein|nr:hypothetical protein [Bacteroidales bacterium]